ncbi:iron chelate uptake ABC transporter family permease subunit [Algoriphagus aquatilis]|uniref:Iron chelate uptake ABC transporter family permease subunit n=1 Tax=Algoriphagus aquatilis TaxID=490186 RepID=A0ABW0BTE2_9BACT
MEDFVYFFTFQDPSITWVVLGITLLGIGSAYVGTFSFLDKKALLGDAISHAVLPGICLGFILAGEKNPVYIVTGAFLSGALATFLSSWLKKNTKLSEDTIIATILSVFFGIGIVMLTALQKSGNPEIAGLNSFIFGNAIGISETDLMIYGGLSLTIIAVLTLLLKEFRLMVFDPNYGKAIGFPMEAIRFLFNVLMILAVVIGIQAIGVVLMAALLITPGAAARFWTDRLNPLLILAACFSIVSGILGTYISFVLPQMPTGPWVVVFLSLFALLSFMFSPKSGIIFRYFSRKSYLRKTHRDHLMKALYKAKEENKNGLTIDEIYELYPYQKAQIDQSIKDLLQEGFIAKNESLVNLTPQGISDAMRIVRLHRLWELYLNEFMNIAPDHVHESAEQMEHLITPELEALLEKRLNFPTLDPHQETIPRENHDL